MMLKKFSQSFMAAEVTLPIPHIVAVILSCAAGAAQVINQTLLTVPAAWHAYIGLGLAVAAYLGIKPLVGDQFRQALPVPAWVSQAITALVGVATIVAGQVAVPAPIGTALAAAVTVLLGLGFAGPAGGILAATGRTVVKVSAQAYDYCVPVTVPGQAPGQTAHVDLYLLVYSEPSDVEAKQTVQASLAELCQLVAPNLPVADFVVGQPMAVTVEELPVDPVS